MVKEFCLNVEKQNFLNITFTPDVSKKPDSFAFVNGIEIISMAPNLYYTSNPESGAKFIGEDEPFTIKNETALEMVYRINVGGSAISPAEDTGMYRSWEDENNSLTEAGYSVLPVEKHDLNFQFIKPYTAPASVYLTARSIGNIDDKAKLRSYNLTWEFPVDSRFYYLVRLHFCEIESVMNKSGDRVFLIYIANQTSEAAADILSWTDGKKFAPYYKDYVMSMFTDDGIDQKKVNLSVALHVAQHDWKSLYIDAILNGIEIFKLSDNLNNLAGPNSHAQRTWPSPPAAPSEQHTKGTNSRTRIIGIVSGVVSGVVLLSIVLGLIFRGGKVKNVGSIDGSSTWWGPVSFSNTKSTKTQRSSLPSDLCRYFSLAEIKVATNNFDDVFIIGRGGFGNVYKGYIDNGTTAVAIKRLKQESSQGAHEFKTEIEMLSQLRHLHLVSLIGYCNDEHEMILVYEYMARGTLREHLYNSDNPSLSWKQRLQICIGAAHGLNYLHTGAKHTIIHRDVKTTNVLLNEKWEAKVSDFGLSKINSISKSHVTTVVKGSFGYLDPEYYSRQQLTDKSDVFSFGVVLCEVLCKRPPILQSVETRQMNFGQWMRSCYSEEKVYEIVDKHLSGKIAPECLRKYCEIAVKCMHDNGSQRPSMNEVAWSLEFAMQLQLSAEEHLSLNGDLSEIKFEDEIPFIYYNKRGGNSSGAADQTVSIVA